MHRCNGTCCCGRVGFAIVPFGVSQFAFESGFVSSEALNFAVLFSAHALEYGVHFLPCEEGGLDGVLRVF